MQRYFSHICDGTDVQADWRKSCTCGRAPNATDISQGSLTCLSKHRHGAPFLYAGFYTWGSGFASFRRVRQFFLRVLRFFLCHNTAGFHVVRDSLPLYPLFISAVCGLFSAPIPTFYIGGLWVNPQTADIKSGYRGRESRTRFHGLHWMDWYPFQWCSSRGHGPHADLVFWWRGVGIHIERKSRGRIPPTGPSFVHICSFFFWLRGNC